MNGTGGGGREEQTVSPDARNTSSQGGPISQRASWDRAYELKLPGVPPSLNVIGSRGKSHWPYTRAKKEWQDLLGFGLMAENVPRKLATVNATARLRFKDKRKRDEGNFRMLLEKALGDILVSGGWLPDDDAERFSFERLVFDEERGDPQTTVWVYVTFETEPNAESKVA